MSEQAFWLIEMQGPAWLMVRELGGGKHYGYAWTGDVQEALRFYSERQAELVMMAVRQDHRELFPTCLIREPRPTEHMWVTQPLADLPEQPFNYQHPSKYGTDVPRRCYLEELTPEERTIRDLVDAVERLGAHPLLTATVIQLMKAGEDLADWVDIGLRDKAIAALSPGNDLVLLDENPAAGDTEVRNQAEGEAPLHERFPAGKTGRDYESGLVDGATYLGERTEDRTPAYLDGLQAGRTVRDDGPDPLADALIDDVVQSGLGCIDTPQIPEGFLPWSGGECPLANGATCAVVWRDIDEATGRLVIKELVIDDFWNAPHIWQHDGGIDDIIAYRIITDAERISVVTDQDRVEQPTPPSPSPDPDVLLENQPGVSDEDDGDIPKGNPFDFETEHEEWETWNDAAIQEHNAKRNEAEAGEAQSGLDSSFQPQTTTEQELKDEGTSVLDPIAQASIYDTSHEEAEPGIEAERTEAAEKPEPKRFGIFGIEFAGKAKVDA